MIHKSTKNNMGLSVVLGYSIMLGISVVLVGILLTAFSSQLEIQETTAIEEELEIATGQIATEFEKADVTIRNTEDVNNILVRPEFTDQTAESSFRVEIDSSPQPNIYTLRVETGDITVEKSFRSQTPVDTSSSANSNRLRIKYDSSDDHLELVNRGETQIISKSIKRDVSGDYVIPDNSEEEPSVEATGDITGGESSTVHGYLQSESNINTSRELEIYSYVQANGIIDLNSNTYVQENVEGGGDVTVGDTSSINGSITSESGQITLGTNVSVISDINATSDVIVGNNSSVGGTIDSGGTIILESDTTIGDIDESVNSSDIICGVNVTINGKSCDEYKNDN